MFTNQENRKVLKCKSSEQSHSMLQQHAQMIQALLV